MRRALIVLLLLSGAATAQTLTLPPPAGAPADTPPPVLAPGAQLVTPKPAVEENWLPKTTADLAGLDKITTRQTPLSLKLGETTSFGTLRITLKACAVRGPDQPADSAAYLDITDTVRHDFGFHSWMLLSDPAVAVVEHPVYDVRVVGCR